MAEPRRAFVCGHPVAHSRSPLIHRFWLEQFSIEGSYERIDVAPETFDQFARDLPVSGFVGGNVTIPHKEAAFAAAAVRDDDAERIGAVNTLWLEDGRLCGGNTDAYGFGAHLDDAAPAWRSGKTAAVLGAGGAARAVVAALQDAGHEKIRIINRTLDKVVEIQRHAGAGISAHGWSEADRLLASTDVLINTTALGMKDVGQIPLDLTLLPAHAIVSDIVYVPLKTELLHRAEQRGLQTVDGLGMLLHQAVPGFERWFGVRPRVTPELRAVVQADLETGS